MEPENDGLEDYFPFQLGGFLGSMLIFQGVCFCFCFRFLVVESQDLWEMDFTEIWETWKKQRPNYIYLSL